MIFKPGKQIISLKKGNEKVFPSKAVIASNAAKSLVKNAASAVRGHQVFRTGDEVKERLKVCADCEHYKFNRCALCGCFMRFKTALQSEHCPAGKW